MVEGIIEETGICLEVRREQEWFHGCATLAVTQGPLSEGSHACFNALSSTSGNSFFDQGGARFSFTLGPTNYVGGLE